MKFVFKNSLRFFLSTSLILLSFSAVANSTSTWSKPNWGFINSDKSIAEPSTVIGSSIKSSLVFDQHFDQTSYRPFPSTIVSNNSLPSSTEKPRLNQPANQPANQSASQPVYTATNSTNDEIATNETKAETNEPTSLKNHLEELFELGSDWRLMSKEALRSSLSTAKQSLQLSNIDLGIVVPSVAPSIETKHENNVSAEGGASTFQIQKTAAKPVFNSAVGTETTLPIIPAEKPSNSSDSSNIKQSNAALNSPTENTLPEKFTPVFSKDASLLIVDGEELNFGELKPIQGASVYWFGYQSGFKVSSSKNGEVFAPSSKFLSARYIVHAPGYIPAVGYATAKNKSIVALVPEQKLPAVIKSLHVVPDATKTMFFGKILGHSETPLGGVTLDAQIKDPFKLFYSVGSFGLFHPAATQTGSSGDFFISGIDRALQYFMPSLNGLDGSTGNPSIVDLPASIVDLSGVGPVISHTIQRSKTITLETDVHDAFSLERPEGVGIRVTVGGQRGVAIPDSHGRLILKDMHVRSSSDLIEINADGYLLSWLSTAASSKIMPDAIHLFTHQQLSEIFSDSSENVDRSKGIAFGNLSQDRFQSPVKISVLNSLGIEESKSRVYYFNQNNRIHAQQDRSLSGNQNFCITNLDPGEYHILVKNAQTDEVISVQVLRAAYETISQIQF